MSASRLPRTAAPSPRDLLLPLQTARDALAHTLPLVEGLSPFRRRVLADLERILTSAVLMLEGRLEDRS